MATTASQCSTKSGTSPTPNQPHAPAHRPAIIAAIHRSEIRLVRLRDGIEALVEMIAIVLCANHFVEGHFRRAMVAPVALNRVPRHRKGPGVLDAHIDFQRVADELEA